MFVTSILVNHLVFLARCLSHQIRITEFNNLFEHIDHQEYRKILAGTEQEMHLKKLRAMQRR
ncbi:hypothetical protein AJR17_000790 [Shigella boydii]|uniref:Uncharacterized protein n=1 Tax=Shigella boydii TaxID=621 RepID=A0A1S9JPV0_SHIBO|nr:hypothetical protein AJR17_000790 [Shigella boydii]